jgi:hypothetical protein
MPSVRGRLPCGLVLAVLARGRPLCQVASTQAPSRRVRPLPSRFRRLTAAVRRLSQAWFAWPEETCSRFCADGTAESPESGAHGAAPECLTDSCRRRSSSRYGHILRRPDRRHKALRSVRFLSPTRHLATVSHIGRRLKSRSHRGAEAARIQIAHASTKVQNGRVDCAARSAK